MDLVSYGLAAALGLVVNGCHATTEASTQARVGSSGGLDGGGGLSSATVDSPTGGGGASSGRVRGPAETKGAVHLENAKALTPFFVRLDELERKTAREDVRIFQYGDSHTASDYGVSVFRRVLTERFGDGGRGFIPLGKPYRRLFHGGEVSSDGIDFQPEEPRRHGDKVAGDGCYGPHGIGMGGTKPTARIWSTYSSKATELELAYLEQPGGGSMEVFVDGRSRGVLSTGREQRRSAYRTFDEPDGPHHVEIRPLGNGPVRVYGVSQGRAAVGITVDALGINGAKASTPLDWDPEHFREQLEHYSPALVLVAYGTNESGDATTLDQHRQALDDLLGRLQSLTPKPSCIVMGPPDRSGKGKAGWTTLPKLLEIVQIQKQVAERRGCAFFDQLEAMGGEGAMVQWVASHRARADHVHLTREGYGALSGELAHDLIRAYGRWKQEGAPRPGTEPPR